MFRLALVVLLALSTHAQEPRLPASTRGTSFQDNLTRGIELYKTGKFAAAADLFRTALSIEPSSREARIYLAYSELSLYQPGSTDPRIQQYGKDAEQNLLRLIDLYPDEELAYTAIGNLYTMQAQTEADPSHRAERFVKAVDWYKKLAAMDPDNRQPFFMIGTLDWLRCYQSAESATRDPAQKKSVAAECGPPIDEGIRNLGIALAIDPEFQPAMGYLGMVLRARAGLTDSPEQATQDAREAAGWEQKSAELALKKRTKPRR